MKYHNSYIISHDIDWFCIVDDIYVHFASAGGKIPDKINDREKLRNIQHQIELLKDIYTDEDIEYNNEAIDKVVQRTLKRKLERTPKETSEETSEMLSPDKIREYYIESFTAMARKGFASFDRTNIDDPEDDNYHLVCKPKDMAGKPEGLDTHYLNRVCKSMVLGDFKDLYLNILESLEKKINK